MFKSNLEEEQFSTSRDAILHRAIAAELRLESHLLGGTAVLMFLVLLGKWQNYQPLDWHLFGAILPVFYIYKAYKFRNAALKNYIDVKSNNSSLEN